MKYLSSLQNKNLSGKTCLLRVDLNLEENEIRGRGHLRIAAILPTLDFLLKNKARIVLLSHRGRPKGFDKKQSLKFFTKIFSEKLNRKVNFIDNFNFAEIRKKIKNSSPASVFLLENLRFLKGEEKNSLRLARQLASLGDIYINDDFAVSHRKDASVAAITKFLPAYAGFLLEKEIKNLNKAMKNPKKPLVVILGGAKVSDKIGLIKSFMKKADYFLIGGGIASTFLAAQGLPVGDSFYDKSANSPDKIFSKSLGGQARKKIILPVDAIIYKRQILDIGPETVKKYAGIVQKAGTIIWNGPMGYIEDKRFANGSKEIVKAIIKSKSHSVIGGGETIASLKIKNQKSKIKNNVFLSTGGGAMLEYLAGKKLPGIEALK